MAIIWIASRFKSREIHKIRSGINRIYDHFFIQNVTPTISEKPFVSSRDDPTLGNLNFTVIFASVLYDILFFNWLYTSKRLRSRSRKIWSVRGLWQYSVIGCRLELGLPTNLGFRSGNSHCTLRSKKVLFWHTVLTPSSRFSESPKKRPLKEKFPL